jgi:VEFS-Box of polycomb protein
LKIYGVAVNPVRHYLHTNPVQTIRPDYDSLRDYDSDEDTSWQDQYEQEKIHDFIDCNPQEKQLMCLWNTFTRRIGPIFSMLMKNVLCRFVVQHAMEIEMAEAYPALCAQLSMFRRDAIITPAESLEVVTRYRSTLLCQSQSAVAGGPQQLQKSDLVTTNGLVTNGFNEISP